MDVSFDAGELAALVSALRARDGDGADAELERGARRGGGVYFTPAPLVDYVTRVVAGAGPIAAKPRILDPAAGDGRFLLAMAREVAGRSGVDVADVLDGCVAIERDPALAELASRELPGAEVRCCEALLESEELGEFDFVVGNPPYIRSIRLGEVDAALRDALRGRYHATSHGEWDLYAAFIEQSLAWLSATGRCGLVVPSRWTTSQMASKLRCALAEAGAVSGLVDFGAEQLFPGATTYTSILFMSRNPQVSVSVARLRADDEFDTGLVETASLGSAPWDISVGRGREIVLAMKGAGPALGELARIVKGTGTNADSVYVLGDADVEAELVRTCVRGRDVVANGSPNPAVRCLVPYRETGELIEPETMQRDYPRAMAYLESHRQRLESRERGRFAGERFYQFGRPQNLATLLSRTPKIIVPDVARAGRAMLDTSGAIVLDSAYAVLPHDPTHIAPILAALNSPAVHLWLRETGIPLRGGYLRLKTAYLKSLPIPLTGDPHTAYGAW